MKETLFLLPGLLCDRSLWLHQIETLSQAYDVRVADFSSGDSIEAFADHVLENAPERFSVAGLSMGGYVVFELLRRVPQRINRAALIDTSPYADLPEHSDYRRALMQKAQESGMEEITQALLPRLIHPSRTEDEALVRQVDSMAHRIGVDGFLRQQTALLNRVDSFDDLSNITCSVLVMVGRQDALTPLKISQEMAAQIPDAKLVEIENCGHLSTMEQPEATTAVLRYWLQN